jgi:predicted MFS family arabinose efflux permease
MFNIMGVVGILVSSAVGGRLFDSWRPAAPFVLIGTLSALVAVFAVYVRFTAPGPLKPGKVDFAAH